MFMEVARLRSFTKASQTLFISQSAISKQIKALEHFYKTALFERHGNSISLTQAGQLLYTKLTDVWQVQQQLHQELRLLNDTFFPPTKLAIGGSTTISLYVLPPVLSAYLQAYPQVQINVLNRNSANIRQALLDHEIDLGIVEGLNPVNTLTYTPFMTDEVVAVCSANSPLKDRRLAVRDLPDIPVALRESGSGTLRAVENALGHWGIHLASLAIRIRLGGTEALKNFVLADTCLAFLPKRAIQKELVRGELIHVPIEDVTIHRTFSFIQRKGTENNALVNTFIRFMQRHYALPE